MPVDVAILGYGRFGRALAQLVTEAGLAVRAYDPQAEVPAEQRAESPRALVDGAPFVVVAVPVPRIRPVLLDLRPFLGRQHVVLDVGSVKVGPVAAMAEVLGADVPWAGTHPLFGPLSLALAERPLRVVLCPAPPELGHAAAAAKVRAFYERIGCEIVEQTAEGHDRVMAHTHALTFFVAKGMIDAGAGMEVPFAPPSFQASARTIETVRSDAGHLFSAIARENPFAGEARKQLLEALGRIDGALDAADSESRRGARRDAGPGSDPRDAGDGAHGGEAGEGGEEPAPGSDAAARFAIPDLGARSPELKATRDHIDAVDRDIVRLLAQREQLSRRAARAKAALGAPVLDASRENEVLSARREWAAGLKLDAEAVADVFRSIMTMSRRAQRG